MSVLRSVAVHVLGPVTTRTSGTDWDKYVAVATFLLALTTVGVVIFTGLLARRTSQLASQTTELATQTRAMVEQTALDVASQHRPVIATRPTRFSAAENAWHFPCTLEGSRLQVFLHNSGPGPALHVRPRLLPGDVEPEPWDSGAIPTHAETGVAFQVARPSAGDKFWIAVTYADLADRPYASTIEITYTGAQRARDPAFRVTDTRIAAQVPRPTPEASGA